MIDFLNARSIFTPKGEVAMIARGAEILWRKQRYKRELLYLESTGTQYIDTEIPSKTPVYTEFCGACVNNTAIGFGAYGSGANAYQFGCVTNLHIKAGNTGYTTLPYDTEKHLWKVLEGGVYIDDTRFGDSPTASWYSKQNALNYILFGKTLFNKTYDLYAFKVYGIKMWNYEKVLIRDMIPVLDWDDVPCMYDKVSGELFYNQGTGEFGYDSFSADYEKVAYLESTGTQWIDTEVLPKANSTSVEFVFSLSKAPTSVIRIFGSRNSVNQADGSAYNLFAGTTEGQNRMRNDWSFKADTAPYKSGNFRLSDVITADTDILVQLFADGSSKIQDGVFSQSTVTKVDCEYSMYLGNINTAGSAGSFTNNTMRFKYCKIWDNGTLVRDFIPCYRKSDNKPGMYDLVTETFYTNAGTGEFLYE